MQTIVESFSAGGYVETRELRNLYYGRNEVYVSFSNDYRIEQGGYDGNTLLRPYGVLAHTVDTVVGRKVQTNRFWGHVFRRRGTKGRFVDNVGSLTERDYQKVLEDLSGLKYIDRYQVDLAEEDIGRNTSLTNAFAKIWEITRIVAKEHSSSDTGDVVWARIMIDLGFAGFRDDSGRGIMTRKKTPCVLMLDVDGVDIFDIMPIQKYRVDPRSRVHHWVNRFNSRFMHKRNRIAKVKTLPHRGLNRWDDGSWESRASVIASPF